MRRDYLSRGSQRDGQGGHRLNVTLQLLFDTESESAWMS